VSRSSRLSGAISHSVVAWAASAWVMRRASIADSLGSWRGVTGSAPLRRKNARQSLHRARSTTGASQQMVQSSASSSRSGIGSLKVRPSSDERVDPAPVYRRAMAMPQPGEVCPGFIFEARRCWRATSRLVPVC